MIKVCDAADCDLPARSPKAPWCDKHRKRMQKSGTLDAAPRWPRGMVCAVEGCERKARGRGLCGQHYARERRHGDPTKTLSRDERFGSVETRFWSKVDKSSPTGCWFWTGAKSKGYGTFNAGDRTYEYAHRFAYALVIGPIQDGMTLDHLCRNPRCVNPAHLEPVTNAENVRRAARVGHHPNAPTGCARGHDWSEHPPYIANRSDGRRTRTCRVCQSERDKARRREDRWVTEHPAESYESGISERRTGAA